MSIATQRGGELTPFGQAVAAALWCSFLAAAAATMLCFAFLDPEGLARGEVPLWWTTRSKVYALGFFLFWVTAAVASALTLFVVRRP
ncbi:MAG TPA: hypothetical protein VJ011_09375 [Steroidobacteraceae bacterium]|nr:hypothetical protein [Steroidobacteraceae bacterium]